MPYLQVLSEFREGVRKIAREKKGEAPCWVPHPCRSPSAGFPVTAAHVLYVYTSKPGWTIVLGQSYL